MFEVRWAAARALAAGPKILLLDEPVAGMNDVEAGSIGDIVLSLAREGVGVLIIEHNIPFTSRLCEQVAVLSGGTLIASGQPQVVLRDPSVVSAYLGA